MLRTAYVVRFFLAAMFVISGARDAGAQVIAESRFDGGADGWTVSAFTSPCSGPLSGGSTSTKVRWSASDGNPGGYFRHEEPGGGGTSFFRAPASFRGDKSAAYGGVLSFDARFVKTQFDGGANRDDVYIQGGGVALIGDLPFPRKNSWGRAEIPLLPGAWRFNSCSGPLATEAQIRAVLANISDVFIRAEHVSGTENQDIDNVTLAAACLSNWTARDNLDPSARWRHAIAVDTDRNVLVLFGGDTGEIDTWEFNLTTGAWTPRPTAFAPSRRGGHCMVYDKARRKIVLSGGGYFNPATDTAVAYSDVWEYDGVAGTWTETTPLPFPRSGHAMAYDSDRNTIVLYGGINNSSNGGTDVLERDSTSSTWIPYTEAGGPPPWPGHSMAYDSNRQRTVIIGPALTGSSSVTVAEWNGNTHTWTIPAAPTTVPGTRSNAACAYDDVGKFIVYAGGGTSKETWKYDGTTWTKLADINPGGRSEHAMAYDPVGHRVLLSGGLLGSNTPQRDLLGYNAISNSWTTLWSRFSPAPRDLLGAAYDELNSRMIIFGGHIASSSGVLVRSDTLAFDGNNWSTLGVTGNPGNRWFQPLVYDSTRHKVIMFGGANGNGVATAVSETWELDLSTLVWTNRTNTAAPMPSKRFDHAAAYDRLRKKVIVHGGTDATGALAGDTWLFDPLSNTWTTLPVGQTTPGLRSGSAMTFDENRGVVVLFGGASGSAGTADNAVWEWNGVTWTDVTPTNLAPVARMRASLVYNPDRRTVVLTGGYSGAGNSRAYTDVWEYDGLRWRALPQSVQQPEGRVAAAVAYDRTRRQIVQFGGDSIYNGTYASGRTWTLAMPDAGCGAPLCPADLNGDEFVDDSDFGIFVFAYDVSDCAAPEMPSGCPSDINADGFVNDTDFSVFAVSYDRVVCP